VRAAAAGPAAGAGGDAAAAGAEVLAAAARTAHPAAAMRASLALSRANRAGRKFRCLPPVAIIPLPPMTGYSRRSARRTSVQKGIFADWPDNKQEYYSANTAQSRARAPVNACSGGVP
jgi:hypothetical protein